MFAGLVSLVTVAGLTHTHRIQVQVYETGRAAPRSASNESDREGANRTTKHRPTEVMQRFEAVRDDVEPRTGGARAVEGRFLYSFLDSNVALIAGRQLGWAADPPDRGRAQ
eukprot:1335744-Prymnesium_polylepis.1